MIMRVGALASSAAAAVATAASPQSGGPAIWHFLGLPFEAPSMIAALFGCTVTRVIIGQTDQASRWFVKVPVDVLTIGTTFFLVVERRPELLAALGTGIFVGTLGATIIKIAEKWGGRFVQVALGDQPATPTPPPAP